MTVKQEYKLSDDFKRTIVDNLIQRMEKGNTLRLTVTVSEMAMILGLNIVKAYEMVKANKVPHIRDGNRIIIPVIQLLDWIDREAWDEIA